MNVNLGIWDKLSRVVVFLLLLAGLSGVFFWYLPLIQHNQRLRKEIFVLEAKFEEQKREAKRLNAALDSLLNDPKTLERLTRERLGLGKSNEMVFRFENGGK